MRNLSSIILLVALCSNVLAQSPHGKDFILNCSDCHTTEGWKVDLKKLQFNHDQTKFPLIGQHTQINCRSCHTSLVFYDAKTDCMSCHTDIHYQTVGFECERCHTPKSWIVENITEIHQLSRFPLVGPHVTADCYSCHPSESLLRFEPLGVECYDCHKDKYMATTAPNHVESNYPTSCEECHLMTSFDWSGANINHSFFPLTGGHGGLDCITCHTSGSFSKIPAECVSCHQENYNSTTNPNHSSLNFSTNCAECHTTNPGWKPADYREHDALFPIYSGSHNGEWNSCSDCHKTAGDYGLFSCTACHQQGDMDNGHRDVGGYVYNDLACYECHPTGSKEGTFNHNNSNFPLTGAHLTTECSGCHANGFAGTPTICFACHQNDFNQTINPNHNTSGIATECETCHTTDPGWKPALFPTHNDVYPLLGAHATIATNCFQCHEGNYVNTPNLCYGCHSTAYNQTTNPNHITAQFSTACETCHNETAWVPATFDHDGQYFPIYSGKHLGTWSVCSDCHTNAGNYAVYTCTSTCHVQGQTDPGHNGVSGYVYSDPACFECHPDGSAEGAFNHANSNFPLTGAHSTTDCIACHANGYAGTPTICFACHETDFNQSLNPNHGAIGIPNDCETCHTTNPGWQPATFPIHNNYYVLQGAHATIASNCFICHEGNYINTPNLCYGCHSNDYLQTNNPNHTAAGFPTNCESCHSETAWTPATFDHDGQFFPIYSGHHQGTWSACSDCHTNPSNYSVYTCTTSCHPQGQTDGDHNDVGGYTYSSPACYECHPTGSSEGAFNHSNSSFPLTGAHITTECSACHINGFPNTPTICFACHENDFNTSTNPSHTALSLPTECETCHTTNPGWQPATFPIHDQYYPLVGAHANIATNCFICHEGNYINTPNLCYGCHSADYNQTTDPNHVTAQFPTTCETCHNETAWVPSTFEHDGQYFPIYSGHHQGTWSSCSDCHQNPANYAEFTCTTSCHPQGQTNQDHNGVGGYTYQSGACYECHPTGSSEGAFNHNNSNFPLTGAHLTLDCIACHASGYAGTPTACVACHETDYNETTNPDHAAIGIPTDCENCHTTIPGWQPATFPIHNQYYPLTGAHASISNDCNACHQGDYNNTPNTCVGCHQTDYLQTTNPDHDAIGIGTDCATCHTTNPGWQPATFPIHNNYWPLTGAHINTSCDACHNGNYNSTPNTCAGCHMSDYNGTNDPNHAAAGFPTDCEMCHTTIAWVPSTFDHDGLYFPIYSGSHQGTWTTCSQCHPNPNDFGVFTCLTCHQQGPTNQEHQEVSGYQYNSDACYACHPTGQGGDKKMQIMRPN